MGCATRNSAPFWHTLRATPIRAGPPLPLTRPGIRWNRHEVGLLRAGRPEHICHPVQLSIEERGVDGIDQRMGLTQPTLVVLSGLDPAPARCCPYSDWRPSWSPISSTLVCTNSRARFVAHTVMDARQFPVQLAGLEVGQRRGRSNDVASLEDPHRRPSGRSSGRSTPLPNWLPIELLFYR